MRSKNVIINPTPICRRSKTAGILGSATVACGNIGSTTLEEHEQIVHQGRRPCFAMRRWPIPKMEIVQRFSFLVSEKRNRATIFLVMSNALNKNRGTIWFFCVVSFIYDFMSKIVQIVDNFYFSYNFISIDLFNFVSNYTMVWSVV